MSKGEKNCYTCQECNQQVITIDTDDGVTPFAIICRATEGCRGMMFSGFYRVDQNLTPSYEWFKPESVDGYGEAMREHIEKGGLDLREIKKTTQTPG